MVELQMRSLFVVAVALAAHVAASSDDTGIAKRFEELERRLRDQEAAIQWLERKSGEQQSMIEGLKKKATEQDSTIQTQQDQIHQLQKERSTERHERASSNADGGAKLDIMHRETIARTPTKRQDRTKVAFTAVLTHDIETGHQPVKFNKIITNEGNAYNNHTGVFTCTEPGMHLFLFYIADRDDNGVRGNWANLVVNSQNTVSSTVDVYHPSQDLQGGNAAILRLNTGDVVWVESVGGHIEGDETYRFTSFSGTFLFA